MEDWIVIAVFTYSHEASMGKSVLESSGINVILKDEMITQINPFYSNAVGGIKLLVNKSDASEAYTLLKEGGFVTEDLPEAKEVRVVSDWKDRTACPFCGSDNFSVKKYSSQLMMVMFFLLGALFPLFRKTYVCFNCNQEWQVK
jgi:transposase-like protein